MLYKIDMTAEEITRKTLGTYDWNGAIAVDNNDNGELVKDCNKFLKKSYPEMYKMGYRVAFYQDCGWYMTTQK